jgi:hypothetical protein
LRSGIGGRGLRDRGRGGGRDGRRGVWWGVRQVGLGGFEGDGGWCDGVNDSRNDYVCIFSSANESRTMTTIHVRLYPLLFTKYPCGVRFHAL